MKRASALVPILASLTACGGSGGKPPPSPMPPPFTPSTNFTAFVHEQMGDSMTTETAVPAEVETVNWEFTDDTDGTQFDDIIANGP